MTDVKAYIAHQSRGRIRLRVPERKNHTQSFDTWQQAIEQWSNIGLVEINAATASILIHYDDQLDNLAELTNQIGLTLVHQPVPAKVVVPASTLSSEQTMDMVVADGASHNKSVPLWQPITQQIEQINKALSRATGGSVDLPTLLFIALVLQGLIQFIRKPALIMPWDTAWWFALNVYLMVRDQA